MSPEEVLIKHWENQTAAARQAEGQRATLTNMILLIALAAAGFVTQHGLDKTMLAITIPLIFVGVYGALASEKLYERFKWHNREARAFTSEIVKLLPDLKIGDVYRDARDRHKQRHPLMSRLRLHWVWTSLHIGIVVLGVMLSIAALL